MPTCSGRRDGSKESESAEPLAESVIGVWRQYPEALLQSARQFGPRKIDERVQRRIPTRSARSESVQPATSNKHEASSAAELGSKRSAASPRTFGQCGRSRCGHRTTGSHRLERWQAEILHRGKGRPALQRQRHNRAALRRKGGRQSAPAGRGVTSQRSDPGQRYGNPHAARRQPARAAGDRRRVQRLRIATVGSCAGAGCRRRRSTEEHLATRCRLAVYRTRLHRHRAS